MCKKERLEVIKEHVPRLIDLITDDAGNGVANLQAIYNDMNWLIEQAERVQELEVWYHSYHKEAKLNNILKIQNKRLREALKNIYELAEYDEYDNTLEQIVSEVEKALEETEWNVSTSNGS